ncbi:MAG: hypothetical protein NC132_03145 [Corallococcus sp.]|nr:hypothetical protein [Corallococcus sp.]MCM1359103.1 hypothetical protein [Corallococcus sp.]MCM1395092.1 hypothetical protein [Corallococcus sp.]
MKTYIIGSKLLGLSNNSDCDTLVILDGDSDCFHCEHVDGLDTMKSTATHIGRYMAFEVPLNCETVIRYIANYQYDADIIGQNFPLKYHILDKRNKYIELLNWIVDNAACNFVKNLRFNKGNCSKIIYHVAYTVFILENGSTALTAEQKAIVQRIHDREMPQNYLDVLLQKIRKLS